MARGHAVRATTRDPAHVPAIEAAGAEAVVGDPDRVATVAPAFEHVGAAVILLGSAIGSPEALAALHGSRLDMLLLRMLDSTVRGIVYEATGSVDSSILGAGAERVRAFCDGSRIPYALVSTPTAAPGRGRRRTRSRTCWGAASSSGTQGLPSRA